MKQIWRQVEDRVTQYFQGKRRPQIKYQKQGNDVYTDLLEIEVKSREKDVFPKWLRAALIKLGQNTPATKIPILIIVSPPEREIGDAEVIIKAKDLRNLILAQAAQAQQQSDATLVEAETSETPPSQSLNSKPVSAVSETPSKSTPKGKRKWPSRFRRKTWRKR